MKTIILISSIFYILGLKISHNIDIIKRTAPIQKIIVHKNAASSDIPAARFEKEPMKSAADSLGTGKASGTSNEILENK